MNRFLDTFESGMEKTVEDLKSQIIEVKQKAKVMTDFPSDLELSKKSDRLCNWHIEGFPSTERDHAINLRHFLFIDLVKEGGKTMKELKKCLDQEITEIKNHQMWNTEVNYIQKQKKIEAEKFAD